MENQTQIVLPAEIETLAVQLKDEKRLQMQAVIGSLFAKYEDLKIKVSGVIVADENDKTSMKVADVLRSEIKKAKIEANKFVDAQRNELAARMADDKLQDKIWLHIGKISEAQFKALETEAENKAKYAEIVAEKRRAELKAERLQLLMPYTEFVSLDMVTDTMTAESFDKLLIFGKQSLEAKQAEIQRQEAERKEREEAERKRQAEIQAENERLKKEAAEKQAQQIAAQKLRSERAAKLQKYMVVIPSHEYETIIALHNAAFDAKLLNLESELKAFNERIAAQEAEQKRIKEERKEAEAERQRLEKQLKEKQEAEQKAKQEAEAESKRKAAAPDKEKIAMAINDLMLPTIELQSPDMVAIYADIQKRFDGFKTWASGLIK